MGNDIIVGAAPPDRLNNVPLQKGDADAMRCDGMLPSLLALQIDRIDVFVGRL